MAERKEEIELRKRLAGRPPLLTIDALERVMRRVNVDKESLASIAEDLGVGEAYLRRKMLKEGFVFDRKIYSELWVRRVRK